MTEELITGRVLTVENMTDTELGFALCRKRDGCLHLHITPPDVDEVHGEPVHSFEPPNMRTIYESHVTDVER